MLGLLSVLAVVAGLETRPDFWRVRPDEITELCASATKCSRKEVIATTPRGHPVHALFYGTFDEPPPRTNASSAFAVVVIVVVIATSSPRRSHSADPSRRP